MSLTPLGRFLVDFGLHFGGVVDPKIDPKSIVFSKPFLGRFGNEIYSIFGRFFEPWEGEKATRRSSIAIERKIEKH